MEFDRLKELLVRLEAGVILEEELDELELLLSDDYESREKYLDHAQMEGLLHSIGQENGTADVVAFDERSPSEKAASVRPRSPRWFVAAALVVLAIVPFAILRKQEKEPQVVAAESDSPLAVDRMSPSERYQRIGMANHGGSSLAHPETAGKTSDTSSFQELEFNRDIRPILSDNCFHCHGPDAAKRKADLRLDTEDGAKADLGGYSAVVEGQPDASELVTRIFDTDPDSLMPPPESKRRLSDVEKQKLKKWIESGAGWQKHWAFEAPVKRDLPEISDSSWIRNEVDHFTAAKMAEYGLKPSPEAGKETLIRRVTLDLTGVPPTIEEIEEFLSDKSKDAYGNLVDRLMKSSRFAERMAWQWLEASRYADTDGYQNDGPRDMWRWRDWVIDAYRSNLPFDQFTVEQLAGDLLPAPTDDQIIATGFNRNHRYNSESGLVLEEFLLENAVDRVDTTSTVWLGLTVGCARCHDHKYDPISQKEYYQLVSIFDNVPESGRAIKFGNSEPWIKAPTEEQKEELAEIEYRLKEAEKALATREEAIEKAQKEWEGGGSRIDQTILDKSLAFHFAMDDPIVTDGSKPHSLGEKVDNLACEKRFSVAFQMTPVSVDSGAVLSNEIAGTTRKGILVWFREGHLRFSIISRWIAGVATLETERTFAPGETVHVTLTNDGTQRVSGMQILIDGKPEPAREIHNTNSNTMGTKTGDVMRVGGSKHVGNWKGEVMDLRFYTGKTLTLEEAGILASAKTIPEILSLPIAERSDVERRKIRQYFLAHAAPENLQKLAERVATLRAREVSYYDSLPTTMVMKESPARKPTHLRVRGEYHNKGELVKPGVPEVFPGLRDEFPANRLGFAKWLVDTNHPLTARVAVNRYWQLLFGVGLVKTAEDFGTQGRLPSHPDLLDWLAVDFMENGWDIQHMIRKIVTSATYRQSSQITDEHLSKDPDNVYLARAPRRKLPGNVLRDQALFVSGLLVEKTGGPSVKPYQPARLWKEASNFTYKQDKGEDLYRRSLYTYWKRTLAPPSMAVLDAADREWCSVLPKKTNTPLQALTLMNETAFFEAARKLGEKTLLEGGTDDSGRIRFLFRTVLSREPSPRELEILLSGYGDYRKECASDQSMVQKMQTVGESRTAGNFDPVELGAATVLSNVILNLEEVTVRE